MNEPLWRKVLCWGSVSIFLLTPPTLLVLQIFDHLNARDIEVAKSMSPMFFAIAGVVASLAGLNTFAAINGKKHNQDKE